MVHKMSYRPIKILTKGWRKCPIQENAPDKPDTPISYPKMALTKQKQWSIQQQITLPVATGFTNNYE